jgi:hypothetical protein
MADPYKTTFVAVPITNDLTVLETVKEELNIEDSENDAILSRYISEQSEVAATYCGRPLSQATVIDSFRLCPGSTQPLFPSRWPVTSIIEFIEGTTTLSSADYDYDEKSGFIWRLNASGLRACWPAATNITLQYIGGYELLTTLPRDIERAVLILIKDSWYARARDPRARSETVEGIGRTDLWVGTVPGGGSLPDEATALLERYSTSYM